MEDKKRILSCVDCGVTNCNKGDKSYPEFCLTTKLSEQEKAKYLARYQEEENQRTAIASAEVECEGYLKLTRVEEIMAFARKIGAKKIGIATCVGLIRESRVFAKILRKHGFEVYGAACKVGAAKKTDIGIPKFCEEVGANMCNPILQAMLLNKEKTDLNVVVGLCVGHDSLFYKYAEGLTTTLITKDRVLGHNPAAALYNAESYYKRLLKETE